MPSTKSVETKPRYVTHRQYDSAGGDYTSTSFEGSAWVKRHLKSWTRTPNYRQRRAEGSLPINPFSYQQATGSHTRGSISKHARASNGITYSDVLTCDFQHRVEYPPFLDRLVSLAANRALASAKGFTVNAPVFLAELNSTSNMVAHAAKTIVHAYLAVKHGQFDEALKGLKLIVPKKQVANWRREYGIDPKRTSSNAWLQMSYGWVPLMSDVRAAVNTLADIAEIDSNRTVRFYGSASETITTTSKDDLLFSYGYMWNVYGDIITSQEHSARVIWYASANALDIPARLGLTNLLEVAWELKPLSFVVDWFLPIGDYLSAFTTEMRYSTVKTSLGQRVLTRSMANATRCSVSGAAFSGFFGDAECVSVLRTENRGGLPWSVSMKFPTSVDKALSAIALLAQKLR